MFNLDGVLGAPKERQDVFDFEDEDAENDDRNRGGFSAIDRIIKKEVPHHEHKDIAEGFDQRNETEIDFFVRQSAANKSDGEQRVANERAQVDKFAQRRLVVLVGARLQHDLCDDRQDDRNERETDVDLCHQTLFQ